MRKRYILKVDGLIRRLNEILKEINTYRKESIEIKKEEMMGLASEKGMRRLTISSNHYIRENNTQQVAIMSRILLVIKFYKKYTGVDFSKFLNSINLNNFKSIL